LQPGLDYAPNADVPDVDPTTPGSGRSDYPCLEWSFSLDKALGASERLNDGYTDDKGNEVAPLTR
jgi:hypothetical protein